MKKILLLVLVSLLFLVSCAQNKPSRGVERVATDTTIDLSGRWNDVDARLTAEEMIRDVMSRPWLVDYNRENGKKPTVIVGTVRNLSSEHIETNTFVQNMQRELINSGQVKFVADSQARNEIRNERLDQQSNASEETAKRLANETGADFMLQGSIKTIVDAIEGKQVKYYQVDLELVNLETNEKAWLGTKQIKKVISQSKTKW